MGVRIQEFDLWKPGYAGAVVYIYLPGTTTLAPLFLDDDLTVTADNPQTLLSMSRTDGTRYGKFAAPVYTSGGYYLNIDNNEETGVVLPQISDFVDEDISEAVAKPAASSKLTSVEEFLGYNVYVPMFGTFVEGALGVPATNTATLELAIAALANGGEVIIPKGTYKVNAFEIPEGVLIRGHGIDSTILQSQIGAESFTIVGARAGFKNITLDGVSLTNGSVGVVSSGNDNLYFENVLIKRFEKGMSFKGGKRHKYKNLSIENTETAAELFGDTDSGNGSAFSDMVWDGGLVSVATTAGVVMSYEDALCENLAFNSVGFENCTNFAVVNNGAQSVIMSECWWDSNSKNIDLHDDSGVLNNDNFVSGFQVLGGRVKGGEVKVTGRALNVSFEDVKLKTVTFNMSTPVNNLLLLKDCDEASDVVITGETSKVIRSNTNNDGASYGLTSTNSATKAWGLTLDPGQVAYLEAKVIGRGQNVVQRAIYHVGCGAFRPGSSLNYDTQTANFNVGSTVTGASSGATARIQADSDSGTTGTLTLIDIVGVFLDNEIITDNGGTPGSATVNGPIVDQNVQLDSGGNTNLRAVYETNANWAAAFVANTSEIELRVTGDSSQTVEWVVDVDVVVT